MIMTILFTKIWLLLVLLESFSHEKKTLKVQSVADGVTIQKSINRTYSQMGKPQSGLYLGQYLEPETRW